MNKIIVADFPHLISSLDQLQQTRLQSFIDQLAGMIGNYIDDDGKEEFGFYKEAILSDKTIDKETKILYLDWAIKNKEDEFLIHLDKLYLENSNEEQQSLELIRCLRMINHFRWNSDIIYFIADNNESERRSIYSHFWGTQGWNEGTEETRLIMEQILKECTERYIKHLIATINAESKPKDIDEQQPKRLQAEKDIIGNPIWALDIDVPLTRFISKIKYKQLSSDTQDILLSYPDKAYYFMNERGLTLKHIKTLSGEDLEIILTNAPLLATLQKKFGFDLPFVIDNLLEVRRFARRRHNLIKKYKKENANYQAIPLFEQLSFQEACLQLVGTHEDIALDLKAKWGKTEEIMIEKINLATTLSSQHNIPLKDFAKIKLTSLTLLEKHHQPGDLQPFIDAKFTFKELDNLIDNKVSLTELSGLTSDALNMISNQVQSFIHLINHGWEVTYFAQLQSTDIENILKEANFIQIITQYFHVAPSAFFNAQHRNEILNLFALPIRELQLHALDESQPIDFNTILHLTSLLFEHILSLFDIQTLHYTDIDILPRCLNELISKFSFRLKYIKAISLLHESLPIDKLVTLRLPILEKLFNNCKVLAPLITKTKLKPCDSVFVDATLFDYIIENAEAFTTLIADDGSNFEGIKFMHFAFPKVLEVLVSNASIAHLFFEKTKLSMGKIQVYKPDIVATLIKYPDEVAYLIEHNTFYVQCLSVKDLLIVLDKYTTINLSEIGQLMKSSSIHSDVNSDINFFKSAHKQKRSDEMENAFTTSNEKEISPKKKQRLDESEHEIHNESFPESLSPNQ